MKKVRQLLSERTKNSSVPQFHLSSGEYLSICVTTIAPFWKKLVHKYLNAKQHLRFEIFSDSCPPSQAKSVMKIVLGFNIMSNPMPPDHKFLGFRYSWAKGRNSAQYTHTHHPYKTSYKNQGIFTHLYSMAENIQDTLKLHKKITWKVFCQSWYYKTKNKKKTQTNKNQKKKKKEKKRKEKGWHNLMPFLVEAWFLCSVLHS